MIDEVIVMDKSSVLILLPKSKTLMTIQQTPLNSIVQVKADGEFALVHYERSGETYTLNKWCRKRKDFPALNELIKVMEQKPTIEKAEFLSELYAVDDQGKMIPLPDFLHTIKGGGDLTKVRLGLFDLHSINDKPVREPYSWKIEELQEWFKEAKLVSPLPFLKPPLTHEKIQQFWNTWVEAKNYEGLVARSNDEIFKIKPFFEADAVIIGINKKPNLERKEVTSIKLALMEDQETFRELSDCASGISFPLRLKLYSVMEQFKVGEDKETIFIKPFIVVNVQYTDTFLNSQNRRWKYADKYVEVSKTRFMKLRHPRLICFRQDKTANPDDLRLTQIPTA